MTAANLHLYEISDQYQAVIDQIAEAGGEVSGAVALELAAIEDRFEEKAEKLALYIRNLEGLALAALDESKRLENLALSRRNTAQGLKQYLFVNMKLLGKEHITRPLAKLDVVNNGGSLPVEWNGEPESIPEPFRLEKTVYALDRALVLQYHKDGLELPPGITVKDRGQRLAIK